ncbi:MAG: transketolase [bacterium]|nr:transketolase [bacterium]
MAMLDLSELKNKADLVRKWCLISTSIAASGHPTSCLSAADITTVLFDKYFNYDLKNPSNPNNDRLIFSKGHAAPLLYALYALAGAFPLEELKSLRKFGSRLEGHPTPNFPYAEAATGSLGQGLSVGAGIAFALSAQTQKSKLKSQNSPRVFVLLGDGEMAEGSVWEGANFASYYKLDNLIAIVDVNRFGQSQETMFGHATKEYANRLSSFGFKTIIIDGHNFKQIIEAFNLALKNKSGKPFAIVAKTKKGKGVSFLENKDGWHGKPLKKEELEKALLELGKVNEGLRFMLRLPRQFENSSNASVSVKNLSHAEAPRMNFSYNVGDEVATREVYGKVLAELGKKDPDIYALDGDTKNSTFSEDFKKVNPDRFIECFIAEQNMVGVAMGLSRMNKKPFVSTFAAFLTRAYDQIRMASISKSNIKFVGSHAGVSIGEDGPSQMGLEDMAMFGTIPDSIIFHPCDAFSTSKIIPLVYSFSGISYLRTLRPKTPLLYGKDDEFKIGGSKILRKSNNDLLTVASCGITVFEALKAYEELKEQGIFLRIVDCYSVKPVDSQTLTKCLLETKQKVIITVEDHFSHGGFGDFVLSALSKSGARIDKMAVNKIARSGKKEELLNLEQINAESIVKKIKSSFV